MAKQTTKPMHQGGRTLAKLGKKADGGGKKRGRKSTWSETKGKRYPTWEVGGGKSYPEGEHPGVDYAAEQAAREKVQAEAAKLGA